MKNDRVLLIHIHREMVFLKRITADKSQEDLKKDEYFSHAVIRAIEVIGEAAKNISQDLKERYSDVEWSSMARMRDRVIHRYFDINWIIVWDVVRMRYPTPNQRYKK